MIGTFELAACMQLAPYDDAPFGEAYFLPYLAEQIPSSGSDGWGDVLGTDVAFR